MQRRPCARAFYPGDLKRDLERFLETHPPDAGGARVNAGIVPHAGWVFSGAVAARVLATLCRPTPPDCFVLLGAVHRWGVERASLYPRGSWTTPLGALAVDEERGRRLLDALGEDLVPAPEAHADEHSIEVQLPMIAHLAPEATILPIALPPSEGAAPFGEALARWVADEPGRVAVVASTDLTHYGRRYGFAPAGEGEAARVWMEANDRRILDLALALKAEEIVPEAEAHHNACGAGAMAAAVAFARSRGATEGRLLDHVTSHDVMPDPVFTMAVGYGGIVF